MRGDVAASAGTVFVTRMNSGLIVAMVVFGDLRRG